MSRIELTQGVAVSPEYLFAFFVPQRMSYWYGAEMDSSFEVLDGAAEFRVGQKVRVSGRFGSRTVSHTAVVTAFEYARLLEWRFQDAYGVRGRERWEIERISASPADVTRVKFTSDYEFPGRCGRLMDRLLTRHAVARRNREYLARLARLAECRAK